MTGRYTMEGLALKQPHKPQVRREVVEISPYFLVEKASRLSAEMSKAMADFWNLTPRMRLFSVSPSPHYYWHMQDFYVAQKGLDTEGKRWAQLRISETLCQLFFNKTLGHSPDAEDFTLAQIRHFEVFLLERFSRQLFQILSPQLIKRPPKKAPPPEQDKLMHILWILESSQSEEANQLIFTVPHVCLKSHFPELEAEAPTIWQMGLTPYQHARVKVRFSVGRTMARLDELKELEVDDIIVFEESSTTQWRLYSPKDGKLIPFPVQLPAKVNKLNISPTQGQDDMANQIQEDIWDNLQVEVTGTFSPFKLPLKRLKEIERGLIIEIADLMENQVQIEVEGHKVAWGELLVVGDKLGVRIQGLHDSLEQGEKEPSALTSADVREAHGQQGADPGTQPQPQQAAQQPQSQQPRTEDLMDELGLDDSDFDDMDNEEDWT